MQRIKGRRAIGLKTNKDVISQYEIGGCDKSYDENIKYGTKYFHLIFIPLVILCIKLFINNIFIFTKDCDLNNTIEKYEKYNDLLFSVSTVYENMQNDHSSTIGVFLLLQLSNTNAETFINDLTKELASCFGNKPARLTSDDFKKCHKDNGCIINHYVELSKHSDVVIVDNLNKLPTEGAHALHAICDTYEPIHKPSMIFLTLTINKKYDHNSSAKKIAIKFLENLWKELLPNDRDMLIARVTDQVFWTL